jgi:hypothetical protein
MRKTSLQVKRPNGDPGQFGDIRDVGAEEGADGVEDFGFFVGQGRAPGFMNE